MHSDIFQISRIKKFGIDMKYVKSLKIADREALDNLMRTSSNFKVRCRAHCIILSAKKYRIEDLANIFDVDRDTISGWVTKWEELGIGGLHDATRTGRPRKAKTEEEAKDE